MYIGVVYIYICTYMDVLCRNFVGDLHIYIYICICACLQVIQGYLRIYMVLQVLYGVI